MKQLKFSLVLFFAFLSIGTFTSCDDETIETPQAQLTQEQSDMLIYMREEEKLARDVYLHFNDKYAIDIFGNIANAEQSHMDKILDLLNKYGYDDPSTMERNTFKNEELQQLFDDLIAKGDVSLVEALKVGATIEDVDIYDLDRASVFTTQSDILDVYEKLNCGSRNHMRAFTKQLLNNNTSYSVQFISQDDYENIINTENEKCGQK